MPIDWRKLLRGKQGESADDKDAPESLSEPAIEAIRGAAAEGVRGATTDPKLINIVFPNAIPVCTDQFLNISRDSYPLPWLVREIVQNFIDANQGDNQGTLNGVGFKNEKIKNGRRRFTITGNWPFPDSTGITSLHSGKAAPRGKEHFAGGNGIGLKQTVLRFMRDYGTETFTVQGEGWIVTYRMVKAEEVNEKLEARGNLNKVQHDWLLADIQPSDLRGSNSYTIETADPGVIAAMDDFENLGVSDRNKYLQDPHFKNAHGTIKWLPLTEPKDESHPKPQKGRLFINGQIMNYKEKGKTSKTYWDGPEGVTVQVNGVDYQISIDRPAVQNLDMGMYIKQLIRSMSKEELIAQLKHSEHLWSTCRDTSKWATNRDGCFVIIQEIVERLQFGRHKISPAEFAAQFGGKNYVALDSNVTARQEEDLIRQGFVLCPEYFAHIGMPKASSKLDSIDVSSNERPGSVFAKAGMRKVAEDYGMDVAFEEFPDLNGKPTIAFIERIYQRLKDHIQTIEERAGKPGSVRIILKTDINDDALFHALPKPKTDDQKLLYLLRGIAFYGLRNKVFTNFFISQGTHVTTFDTYHDHVAESDNLIARNVKSSSDKGVFIEFELEGPAYSRFKELFLEEGTSTPDAVIETTEAVATETASVATVRPIIPEGITDAARVEARRRLGEIPVQQPPPPAGTRDQPVVIKTLVLTLDEEDRLKRIEKSLPAARALVEQLHAIVPAAEASGVTQEDNDVIGTYAAWRASADFYGQAGQAARYLTGKHVLEILDKHNQAAVPVVVTPDAEMSQADQEREMLQLTLKSIAERLSTDHESIDEFEIVTNPTEAQLAQLALMRFYMHITTGAALPNDLFIYKGTGKKAVNIGQKAIGIHESLLQVSFPETLAALTHEIAHNAALDHGVLFMHTMQSLFAATIDKLSRVGQKALAGETVNDEEKAVIDIQNQWDVLKQTA